MLNARVTLLALLLSACGGASAEKVKAPDLASNDLARAATNDAGRDFSSTGIDNDFAITDIAEANYDLTCTQPVGSHCTTLVQCACTPRKICVSSGGDNQLRCALYPGDSCTVNNDCGQINGANGTCVNNICQ